MVLVLLVIRCLLEQEEEQVCVFMTHSSQTDVFFSQRSGNISKKVGGLSCFPKDISFILLDFCMARERERGPFALLSHFTSSGLFFAV